MQIMHLHIANLDSCIHWPEGLTSQRSISRNILISQKVIFLQKSRYVNSLFYAKEYDEVIKNVEEIFEVDKSRTYMNRIAGYSCYEKNPPDYEKALAYMEELFRTVAPERIIAKDYQYLARILVKKNINTPKIADEAIALKAQIEKEKTKLATTTNAAEKAKIKANIDEMTPRADKLEKEARKAGDEVNRAYAAYGKVT